MLLEIKGGSVAPKGSGCRNGRESTLLWLKIDGKMQPVDARPFLVESCVSNIQSYGIRNQNAAGLTLQSMGTSISATNGGFQTRHVLTTLRYDSGHPEAGVQTFTSVLGDILPSGGTN